LIRKAQSGDADSRQTLVESNLKLVMSIIGRFNGRAEPDDLFQIGCVGLLKAVDRFNLNMGVRFSTYAVPLIIGEIRQFLREDGAIKLGRTLKECAGRVQQCAANLAQQLGRDPTVSEIAAAMGATIDEVATALEASQPVQSLSLALHEHESDPLLLEERVPAQEDGNWLEHYALNEALATLPEKYQKVLRLRYFEEKTQTEIAAVIGISQVQVCRIEKRALQLLNELLRE
jgi:RNA polymerase sporulation-specific sigma factor